MFIGIAPQLTLNMQDIEEKDKLDQIMENIKISVARINNRSKEMIKERQDGNLYTYSNIYLDMINPNPSHIPKTNGRVITIEKSIEIEKLCIEINNNGYIFSFTKLSENTLLCGSIIIYNN